MSGVRRAALWTLAGLTIVVVGAINWALFFGAGQ